MVGMLLPVGALMGIGFVVCWCLRSEFTGKTQACLFSLPVSRRRLAYAKFTSSGPWCFVWSVLRLPFLPAPSSVFACRVQRIWWPLARRGVRRRYGSPAGISARRRGQRCPRLRRTPCGGPAYQRRWGLARIAWHLHLAPSTVRRILARYGCPRPRWMDPATGARVRAGRPGAGAGPGQGVAA
jgi:hypothetical protein